jgi:hypothetical protein
MTNQELAQEVARRLWDAEAAAEAAAANTASTKTARRLALARLKRLRRAHGFLQRAHKILMDGGDVQPLSGSPIKP